MTKLQITLTDQEADILKIKAASFGYNLTRFVKFILGQKVLEYDASIPTYRMSAKTEKRVEEALADYEAGRTISVNSIEELDKIIQNDED